MHTFTFRYTRPFLRRFYMAELWRTHGGFLIALPIALAVILLMARSQDLWWMSGFFAGLIIAYVLLLHSSYQRLRREMSDRSVHATASEAGLEFDVESVTSNAPWAQIRLMRRTAHAVVLNLRPVARPIVVPRDALSAEVYAFMQRSVSAAGGTVRDGG